MTYHVLVTGLILVSLTFSTEIRFSVTESFGRSRINESVSGGIALKKGEVRNISSLALFRGTQEIPGQFSPLTRHPDNSLQWVLVDFTDDLSASEKKEYSIKTQSSLVQPLAPVTVSRSGSVITIENGVLQLKVDTLNFRGIHSLIYKGTSMINGDGGLSLSEIKHGSPTQNGPVTSARFVYLGTSRATLRIQGKFFQDSAGGVGYSYMISVYAGSPRVYISAALRNSINPNVGRAARILYANARFPLSFTPAAVTAFDTVLITSYARTWSKDTLRTTRAFDGPAGKGLAVTEKYGGGNYQPNINQTRLAGNTVEIDIIRKLLAVNSGAPYNIWNPLFYEDSIYVMRDLTHKTSEIILECYDGSMNATALRDMNCRMKGRLRVFQDPASLSEANAMSAGKFGTVADETAAYAKWGWNVPANVRLQHLPEAQTDLCSRLTLNIHGDTETDPIRNFLLQWVRMGKQGLFDVAEGYAKLYRDVVSWRTDGFVQDGQYQQGAFVKQFAKRLPASPAAGDEVWTGYVADYNTYGGCHTAMEGMVDYYCLTGDPDALDAIIDYGEMEKTRVTAYYKQWPERAVTSGEIFWERAQGRKFAFLVRLYEITRSQEWGDLLKRFADVYSRSVLRHPLAYGRATGMVAETGRFQLENRTGLPDSLLNYMNTNRLSYFQQNYKSYGIDSVTGEKWELSGGSRWEGVYMAQAFARCYEVTGDENVRDMLIGFAQYAKWIQMNRCGFPTDYQILFDVPRKGMFMTNNGWNEWSAAHSGCKSPVFNTAGGSIPHYSAAVIKGVLYPSVYALAYAQTGYSYFKSASMDIWHRAINFHGSQQRFNVRETEIFSYALCGSYYGTLIIPSYLSNEFKDDFLFTVTNAFREAVHHTDTIPPEQITDFSVSRLAGNSGLFFQWTAPPGAAEYQVKYFKGKRIQEYPEFEYDYQKFYASGDTNRIPWWYANNLSGEPIPAQAGSPQSFSITGDFPVTDTFYAVICSRDSMGNLSKLSNLVRIDMATAIERNESIASQFGMTVRPNPFNPYVKIQVQLNSNSEMRTSNSVVKPEIKIYNCQGKLVRILTKFAVRSSLYETEWNGRAENGKAMASGVYAIQMTAGPLRIMKKVTLVK